jgi:two-component system cell cycle response regulator
VDETEHDTLATAPTRTPATGASQPYLIVLTGKSLGQTFRVEQGEAVVGRSVRADVFINDDGISRSHAKIRSEENGRVMLVDLASTNGTFVEGERLREPRSLKDGDRIRIGSNTVMKFSFQSEVEEQFQRQLYESATRDPLTNMHNKRVFDDQLSQCHSLAVRKEAPLTVLALDLDHFKKVNDTYGHPAGDKVLGRVARLLIQSVRNEDTACRVGGEEFAILLRDTGLESAAILAERLRAGIEALEIEVGDTTLKVTASIGLAALDKSKHERPEALADEADQRLYRAKREGRNRVCATSD